MSDISLTGSIALTKLECAKTKTKKGNECLLIPIDSNLLEVDDNGNVYLPVRLTYKPDGDQYGQNGFIAKSIGSKHWKEASDEQKEKWKSEDKTPILGSIKDWSTGSSNDSSGLKTSVDDPDSDDLPF